MTAPAGVVEDFAEFGGHHCETASLRKLLRFHGVDLSEELLFGLGGGVGFMHLRPPNGPPFTGCRNGAFPDFVLRAATAAGHGVDVVRPENAERAYHDLLAELRRGRPVICYGDIYFLPYFQAERHFGGHAFVVYGIDETEDRVLVSDRGNAARTVTTGELARSRGSVAPPFPAGNAYLRVEVDQTARPGNLELRAAIRACCHAMLDPPAGFGLAGLLDFADQLDRDVATEPGPRLLEILRSAYVDIELAGTGGAGFRAMYQDFLHEARDAHPAIAEALPLAEEAVVAWRRLVDALLPPLGPGLAAVREGLRDKETVFVEGTTAQAGDGRASAQVAAAGPAAADELDRHRGELRRLRALVTDIHRAETRLFTTLRRV